MLPDPQFAPLLGYEGIQPGLPAPGYLRPGQRDPRRIIALFRARLMYWLLPATYAAIHEVGKLNTFLLHTRVAGGSAWARGVQPPVLEELQSAASFLSLTHVHERFGSEALTAPCAMCRAGPRASSQRTRRRSLNRALATSTISCSCNCCNGSARNRARFHGALSWRRLLLFMFSRLNAERVAGCSSHLRTICAILPQCCLVCVLSGRTELPLRFVVDCSL